jgi:hypothetical protein
MKRQWVSSSNIHSIGYDSNSQTLEIEFHSGDIYHYFSVPPSTYNGLMSASSHGSFLASHINGQYGYAKVG